MAELKLLYDDIRREEGRLCLPTSAFRIFISLLVIASLCVLKPALLSATENTQRVISLSPSITEIIYKLGEGDKLIAVTKYCDYPKEAKQLPKVGGYIDTNIETIIGLEPSLVILPEHHPQVQRQLGEFNIDTLSVTTERVGSIYTAISKIGTALNREARASSLIASLQRETASLERSAPEGTQKRVLVIVDESIQSGLPAQIYVAGNETFHDDLLKMAGATNAANNYPNYPMISFEGVITLNPDAIFLIFGDFAASEAAVGEHLRAWHQHGKHLNAVRSGALHAFSDEVISNPGPRFIEVVELFREALRK